MNRLAVSLAIAIALPGALAACQRSQPPAQDVDPRAEVASSGPRAADGATPAPSDAGGDGGSFAGGIPAEAIAAAAQQGAPAYGGSGTPNLDSLKAAVDRVQQANERLRQAEANKPRVAPVPASPAPQAPASPATPQGLPPVQFRLTGDSIVPKAPELANDVMRGMQRVFAAQTGCTAISGIDTRAVSAQGPFDKNAQGRLVSGTVVERWTVSGCGKTTAYHLVLRVRPDSTVDYAIQGA